MFRPVRAALLVATSLAVLAVPAVATASPTPAPTTTPTATQSQVDPEPADDPGDVNMDNPPPAGDNIDDVLANPVEPGMTTPAMTPGSCLSGQYYAYLFCFTTSGARKTGKAAINYAQDPSNLHWGVPFSSITGGGSLRNKTHGIYVIYYVMKNGDKHTWKYGITSQQPYTKRTDKQLAGCNASLYTGWAESPLETKKGSCAAKLLAISGPADGWGRARLLEASMVLRYVVNNGLRDCPPGQFYSCR